MKFKKVFLIIILLMVFIAIGTVSAMKIEIGTNNSHAPRFHSGENHLHNKYYNSSCYNGYNKKCKHYGYSELNWGIHFSGNEFKKIKFVNVKINGKSIRNVKVYEVYDGYAMAAYPDWFVKDDVAGKKLTITVYNKQNKVVEKKTSTIKMTQKGLSYQ